MAEERLELEGEEDRSRAVAVDVRTALSGCRYPRSRQRRRTGCLRRYGSQLRGCVDPKGSRQEC